LYPGGARVRVERAFYNGDKKFHCLAVCARARFSMHSSHFHAAQWQGGVSFNGLCLSLYGPDLGSVNDRTMLTESGLRGVLLQHCEVPGHPGQYYIGFGDAGYDPSPVFGVPEARAGMFYSFAQRMFNRNMSSQRIVVETVRHAHPCVCDFLYSCILTHITQFFGAVVGKFRYLDSVRAQKMGCADATPALTYKACVLLQNMIACSTQSSWGSQYFGCALPTLDEYVAMADVVDEV
jgi:DDE superfamily endonuclease